MVDEAAIGERFRAPAGELDELPATVVGGRGGALSRARRDRGGGARDRDLRGDDPAGGASWNPVSAWIPARCAARAAGARRSARQTRRCCPTSNGWWTRTAAAIPSCRCAGRPRACASSRTASASWATGCTYERRQAPARLGYSLQANAKTREGTSHPDRDGQFRHINATVKAALLAGEPVISADTQEEGARRGLQERRARTAPDRLPGSGPVARLPGPRPGQGDPLWRPRPGRRRGLVSVGIDHDTAQFAVASIRGWWEHLGGERYPQGTSLTIPADCDGSNG